MALIATKMAVQAPWVDMALNAMDKLSTPDPEQAMKTIRRQ